jgi:hypothetical protein
MKYALAQGAAADELMGLLLGEYVFSTHYYVNVEDGNDTVHDGLSADRAFATMGKAFTTVTDNGVIHLRGPVTENLTCPDGITGVTVVGDGAGLRHGSTSNVAEGYAASWFDDSEDPLVQVHSQGWTFANILFAPHSGDAAIEILSDSGEDPEHSASGLRVVGNRFAGGEHAIKDVGGSGYVTVAYNHFDTCTTAAIQNTSISNALPLQWRIYENDFVWNAIHIDAAFSKSFIYNNRVGLVSASGLYIDLTGGANNEVAGNYLAGSYDNSDYIAGTSDVWAGNYGTAGLLSDAPPTT